jgi:hypothetical protein
MAALVNQVNYTPKMPSVKSRALTVSILPTNGSTFNASNQQIHLDIPTGQYGQYLNQAQTYLKFTVTNNDAVVLTLDRDVSCLFSRMQVSHGSGIVEDISEYSTLYRMMNDCQVSAIEQNTVGSNTLLHGEGTVGNNTTVYAANPIAAGGSATACMPLLSGVVGAQCPKYLPLGALGGGGNLRLTLTLDTLNNVGRSADGGDIQLTLSDIELVCGIVEVDSAAQQMIDASSAGVYAISSTGYKNYTANAGGSGETEVSLLVPAKASSMKSLFTIMRPQAHLNNIAEFGIGCRDRADLTEYHVSVGGQRVPAGKPIKAQGQAFLELMKCFNGISNINQRCDFGKTRFELTTSTANDTAIATKGAFVAGVELEAYGNDGVESGMNTLGANMFWNGTFDTITEAQHFSFFSMYDTLLSVDASGILSVKY